MSRQVVLDTETTGLDPKAGHRIIEIGCVEIKNRRLTGSNFHQYIKPDREIDSAAQEVHGISNEFLADKPLFAEIWQSFIDYVDGAQLIIHNAPFDVGFINEELRRVKHDRSIEVHCTVLDSLALARKTYPGQRNSLDALCKRLDISNAHRTLHGALLDSEILADVYLRMTGGQTDLMLEAHTITEHAKENVEQVAARSAGDANVILADSTELAAHAQWVTRLQQSAGDGCLWSAQAETKPGGQEDDAVRENTKVS